MNGIEKAVAYAGTQAALARLIGRNPQEINVWMKSGKPPEKHCRKIKKSTSVSLHDLRPDKFDTEDQKISKFW